MGNMFAGLGFTAAMLAAGIAMMRRGKAPRITAWIMFAAGAGLFGTWWLTMATKVASALPAPLVIGAAVFMGLGFFMDVIGKNNRAGKATQIIGFFVPLLILVAPVSVFGVDPGDIVKQVKTTADSSNIITTTYHK